MKYMTVEELRPIVESLIYVSEEPIGAKQLAAILEGESVDDIQSATDQLAEEFNARGGGLELRQLAGGYPMKTRPGRSAHVRRHPKTPTAADCSLDALR